MITRDDLLDHFPWLGTDEPISGADVIQELVCWFLAEAPEKKAELKTQFPWLGTEEPVDGADVIDHLNFWYLFLSPEEPFARFWKRLCQRVRTVLGGKKDEPSLLERS